MKKKEGEDMLYCGAARECITPPMELMTELRGLGGRHFSGVIVDDLFIRVLALQTGDRIFLIVAFELDKVPYPERFMDQLSDISGVPKDNILLFSTHVHTAPICGHRPDEPMNDTERRQPSGKAADEKYMSLLLERADRAVRNAIAQMRPVRLGWAEGESFINVNRVQDFYAEGDGGPEGKVTSIGVNFEGPVDHTLWVMRIETQDGEPIAFLINYAVHNVAMISTDSDGQGHLPISSDIGGNVSQMLERRYPGTVAIWSSGAAGDVNPVMFNDSTVADEKSGMPAHSEPRGMEAALQALSLMSHRHYADVLAVLRKIKCDERREVKGSVVAWTHTPGRICRRISGGEEILTGDDIPTYDVREQVLLLGDIALCGFSGELYTSIGRRIKEVSESSHIVVINNVCSLMANSGYIFDDETLERISSSVRPIHIAGYGSESHILPGYVCPALLDLTEKMLKKLERNRNYV